MREDLSETKICVQQILPQHQKEFNDIHSGNYNPEHLQKLQAAFFTKKIWPTGSKINIGFMSDGNTIKRNDLSELDNDQKVDPLQKTVRSLSIKDAVKKIVEERISPLVNLEFTFVDDLSDANVRISFDPAGGAWSLVGTDHLQQKEGATMNLGWFDVPTTIHEFGHLIGLIHEHQNPKGKKIMWDDKKVFDWAKEYQGWSEQTTKENIINKYDKNTINGSNFDPLSIMLYFFPPSLTTNGIGTRQNFRLSGEDVIWIDKTYHKDGMTPDAFYKNTYGDTLESSITKSKKLSKKFDTYNSSDNSSFIDWKLILAFTLVVLAIIALILYLIFFRNKK